MVKALHAAGLEVILDVVFNHTAEGGADGPTLCFRGLDDAAYYRLDEPAATSTTPAAATRSTRDRPHGAAAGDGRAAPLARGDARRRVPLRPRGRARARRQRVRPARRVPAGGRAGPGAGRVSSSSRSPGTSAAATRSATSRSAGASGTAATATPCATSGAARRGRSPDFATRLAGSADLYGGRGSAPDGVDQPRHRPRRVHARRPRQLRRQAQRGQRRGQPRRHRRQPQLELRRRGADATTPTSWRCARGSRATCSPRSCSRRAYRCSWAATSSATRRAATTTPTARTTRPAGCDWRRRRGAGRAHRVRGCAVPAALWPPGLPPPAVLPRRLWDSRAAATT